MSTHHNPQDRPEPCGDWLDEEEEFDEDAVCEDQSSEPRSRWKWLVLTGLMIAIGTWAVKEARMDEIRAKTADRLEATLDQREREKARMFGQLRLLKEQRDQGQISDEAYRARLKQITKAE